MNININYLRVIKIIKIIKVEYFFKIRHTNVNTGL